MINIIPEVLQALENSPALISHLGGPHVYQLAAPDPEQFPRITFFEMTNLDSSFADNVATGSDIYIQIDIWSKGSTTLMSESVDRIMKGLRFHRYGTATLFEPDTRIYHKAMRYVTIREEHP